MAKRAIWLDAAERELLRRVLAHVAAAIRPDDGEERLWAERVLAKQWTRDGLHALLAKVQEPTMTDRLHDAQLEAERTARDASRTRGVPE